MDSSTNSINRYFNKDSMNDSISRKGLYNIIANNEYNINYTIHRTSKHNNNNNMKKIITNNKNYHHIPKNKNYSKYENNDMKSKYNYGRINYKKNYSNYGKSILLMFMFCLIAIFTPMVNGSITLTAPDVNSLDAMPKTFRITITVGATALEDLQLVLEPASADTSLPHTWIEFDNDNDNANSIPANTVFDFEVVSLTTLATDHADQLNAVEFHEEITIDYNNNQVFTKTGGPAYNPQDYPTTTSVLIYIYYKTATTSYNQVQGLKVFDSETLPPTLNVLNINNVFASNFQFQYTTPEEPEAGSVKMLITPLDANADSNGVRTIVFSSELEVQQSTFSTSIDMDLLSELATDSTAVTSVSPATNLVDTARYNITFQYTDKIGNAPASTIVADLTFDGVTITPILIKPATGVLGTTRMPVNFNLSFTLLEAPQNGSVIINIVPITYSDQINDNCSTTFTSISRDLTLTTDSVGTVSQVFTPLENAESLSLVSSLAPKCNLTNGASYVFRLSYQDVFGNPCSPPKTQSVLYVSVHVRL